MGQSVEMGTIHAGDFMVRFSSSESPFSYITQKFTAFSLTPDDLLLLSFQRRFCSNLGMTNQAVKAAQEAVQKSEEFDIRYMD